MVVIGTIRRRAELRKHPRKQIHHAAWIYLGGDTPLRSCTIYDISNTGVRITLATEEEIPAEFTLLLTADGRARRRCSVIWRDGFNVGAEFIRLIVPVGAPTELVELDS
jgi:PilZ domain